MCITMLSICTASLPEPNLPFHSLVLSDIIFFHSVTCGFPRIQSSTCFHSFSQIQHCCASRVNKDAPSVQTFLAFTPVFFQSYTIFLPHLAFLKTEGNRQFWHLHTASSKNPSQKCWSSLEQIALTSPDHSNLEYLSTNGQNPKLP